MENFMGMDCCAICGEPKSIAVCTKFRKNAKGDVVLGKKIPEKFCSGPELCDKCLQKMKDNNTFVIYEADGEEGKPNPRFTGRWMIVNFETVNKDAPVYDFINENRFILANLEEYEHFLRIADENKQKNRQ